MAKSKPMKMLVYLVFFSAALWGFQADAQPGPGNEEAIRLAGASPLIRSAERYLLGQVERLRNATLRNATQDALSRRSCVQHRANVSESDKEAIVEQLRKQGLFRPADADAFPGGAKAGVFPAVFDEGTACPRLPQTFYSAPGSVYGGHHSYPGGLVVHETFNNLSDLQLAAGYRRVYGTTRHGLPVIGRGDEHTDINIDEDLVVAAPIWHDWGKMIVFQWNGDGSEFPEFNFGGDGDHDAYGAPGDSRTGGHHIIGLAEAMARGLAPDFVISFASAHSTPTSGNEYKVVNWIRAAAMIARIDPVKQEYLHEDSRGQLRLPPLRQLGNGVDLNELSPSQTNVLAEYVLHNISDSDFTLTGPAVTIVQFLLQRLAEEFGYDPAQTSRYNRLFRNPALTYLSAERLLIIYGERGIDGVRSEIRKLRRHGIL